MSVWRCRLCEGVNRGGRVCATCGAAVPAGEPLRAAVRAIAPSSTQPAVAPPSPPVPPTTRRRDLRAMPAPEEIHPVDSEEHLDFTNSFDIRPLPGGCLMTFGPRRSADR